MRHAAGSVKSSPSQLPSRFTDRLTQLIARAAAPQTNNCFHFAWRAKRIPARLQRVPATTDSDRPSKRAENGVGASPVSSPIKTFLQKLGPGLITGASDDDPSGIATYSQTGAQFGYGMAWVMLFSYPLMIVIQEICARIGRVTGAGIAANMRKHYPRPLLFAIVSLLCLANVFNLGADL